MTKGAGKQSDFKLDQIKKVMQENSQSAVQIMASEGSRVLDYQNYKAICDNIPECSMALETYVSNILSPDDFTKSIFNVFYQGEDEKASQAVKTKVNALIEKYDLEEKTDKIVSDTCKLGDCFVAVLPYRTEMGKLLYSNQDNGSGSQRANQTELYEQACFKDLKLGERDQFQEVKKGTDIKLDLEEEMAVNEFFGIQPQTTQTKETDESKGKDDKSEIKQDPLDMSEQCVADFINTKIHVKSVTSLFEDRAAAEFDSSVIFNKDQIDIDDSKLGGKNGKAPKKLQTTPVVDVSGSSVRFLDPDRTVKLEIDDVCYGYYYIEPGFTPGQNQTAYDSQNGKYYATTTNPLNPSLTPQGSVVQQSNVTTSQQSQNLNVSDEKLQLIANVFLKGIGKKLNKKYIENNKQFKDIIYSLLKQRYIINNGISVTYFLPSEVIHFKTKSIFSNIVFFAKLYLANLTNIVLIKLGRGHDKRVFYVNAGLDNNHEQAIAKVVQDVKTKEFKMSNIGSIQSLLSLNPGAFDDYYIPVSNGEKPVDIETIQGMDQDLNNDFMEFLRKSMIQGTGLPQAILEANESIEFARQIAAQNANFCRKIIRIQKQLSNPFSDFIRALYRNEYQQSLDKADLLSTVDLSKLQVQFPSPGSLNMSNMNEQLIQAQNAADAISKVLIPEVADQSTQDQESFLKAKLIKELVPYLPWDKYEQLMEDSKAEITKSHIIQNSKDKARRQKDMESGDAQADDGSMDGMDGSTDPNQGY